MKLSAALVETLNGAILKDENESVGERVERSRRPIFELTRKKSGENGLK